MKFKLFSLFILLILLSNFFSGIAVTEINDTISNTTNELKQQNINILAKLINLENAVNKLPDETKQIEILNNHLDYLIQENQRLQSELKTSFILIGLSFVGVLYSTLLLLKGRGKL